MKLRWYHPNRFTIVCMILALGVWTVWLAAIGPNHAQTIIRENWSVTLTMIFGSFVAGATSEGGGAVAFPVFTRLLRISPGDAKLFSLAIQSIGMTSAALAILVLRIRISWQAIFWSSLGGVPGIYIGLTRIAPILPAAETKMFFSSLQASFAMTLYLTIRRRKVSNSGSPPEGCPRILLLTIAGLFGGMASGVVGSGIDLIVFSILVLTFGVSEKVATPTSVVLMAINSVVGIVVYHSVKAPISEQVYDMWIAAVPVVVVGAPAGAYFCSLLARQTIAWILISLIAFEFITSLLILPKTVSIGCVAIFTISIFLMVFKCMPRCNPR